MIVHGCQYPLQIARMENICSLDVFTAGLRWAIAPPFPRRSTFWANYLTFLNLVMIVSFHLDFPERLYSVRAALQEAIPEASRQALLDDDPPDGGNSETEPGMGERSLFRNCGSQSRRNVSDAALRSVNVRSSRILWISVWTRVKEFVYGNAAAREMTPLWRFGRTSNSTRVLASSVAWIQHQESPIFRKHSICELSNLGDRLRCWQTTASAQPNRISSWPGREIMSIMALFACQVIAIQPNLYR